MEQLPVEPEDAGLALVGWVDSLPALVTEELLTQLVDPEHSAGDGQQQGIAPLWVGKM
jgi:hypothetical protein